jgi:phosphoribosylaminoimidazolecarboxamide formyltransferase / IMP cyclohydrolase
MKRNILISVFNKKNLEILAEIFNNKNDVIISTGGTAKTLRKLGLEVKDVGELTGFPEVMDGRVKTLYPKIHMGLLARKDHEEDLITLKKFDAEFFDIVIGNLYDFEAGIKQNNSEDQQIELIDIGGPSFLRSAAKSYQRITVICDPEDYTLLKKPISLEQKKLLAAKVFRHTSYYDSQIAEWLTPDILEEHSFGAKKIDELRYGENPQQKAIWLRNSDSGMHNAEILQGKALSYNNILDLDAAVQAVLEFTEPAVVCVKHTNPCGVSLGSSLYEAAEKSVKADPVSIFGGIIACNQVVSEKEAQLFSGIFLECIIAPGFTKEAEAIFAKKKNVRLLSWPKMLDFKSKKMLLRSVAGGYLAQAPDKINLDTSTWKIFGEKPSDEVMKNLVFAWKVCAHLKSNAIAVVSDLTTVGLGMGQVNRVDAVEQAFKRKESFHPGAKNLVVASDAFFPFADSIELIHSCGAKWIIQPGGSIKDEEVISKAKQLGVTILMTGERHFKH